MLDVVATGINLLEQLVDVKKQEYEDLIASAQARNTDWLLAKVFQFQLGYNVQLNPDFTIGYAVNDDSAKIVTFATVYNQYGLNSVFGGNGLTINVAKGSTPTPLTNTEVGKVKTYVSQLIRPGIPFTIQTGAGEQLEIDCEVRYDSRYDATIQSDVFAALTAYISKLETGALSADRIFKTIEDVPGVKLVIQNKIVVRVVSPPSSTVIFEHLPTVTVPSNAGQFYFPKFGYMVQETTGGSTWSDTITFTPVN